MKIVELGYEIMTPQDYSFEGGKKFIERVARTCYKSEEYIKEGSADKLYNNLVNSEHFAMLEHYTVYLVMDSSANLLKYTHNKYNRSVLHDGKVYITTNLRVIIENDWMDVLEYAVNEPTKYHEKRYSVKFYANIGVSREYNRHRVNSMAESSTRYCNYAKDKFGKELRVVCPSWHDKKWKSYSTLKHMCGLIVGDNESCFDAFDYWLFAMMSCEFSYMNLIRLGFTPDKARGVLPLDTATELIHTAYADDWEHFFELRTSIIAKTGKPHQQASEIADPLYLEFVENGFINKLI